MARLSPARRLALDVCAHVRKQGISAQHALADRRKRFELSAEDAAFAELLIRGTLSTQGVLDESIDASVDNPESIKTNVRDALRISAYELLYLGKDHHAAVSQGVELVRCVAPQAARFANYSLRRIAEASVEFPFGDVLQDDNALFRSQGFPYWLGRALVEQMGRGQAASFMEVSNEPAPLFVAINPLKLEAGELESRLDDAGISFKPVRMGPDADAIPGCLRIKDSRAVSCWPLSELLESGAVVVSDASAQAIASLAASKAVEMHDGSRSPRVLEVGAGRGTKTALMQFCAQRLQGAPLDLTCVDIEQRKLESLTQRARLCGFGSPEAIVADARLLAEVLEGAQFDVCLVDAPCSGLGTLRRHPEIRWRLQHNSSEEFAQTGLDILSSAARCVRPGGVVVHSTCTVLSQENELVIDRFLSSTEGACFDILPVDVDGCSRLLFKPSLAHHGPDAHFACVLAKRAGAQSDTNE